MAIFKIDEIRNMNAEEIAEELHKLESDSSEKEASLLPVAPGEAGRIRDIRRTVARIKTVQTERRK